MIVVYITYESYIVPGTIASFVEYSGIKSKRILTVQSNGMAGILFHAISILLASFILAYTPTLSAPTAAKKKNTLHVHTVVKLFNV